MLLLLAGCVTQSPGYGESAADSEADADADTDTDADSDSDADADSDSDADSDTDSDSDTDPGSETEAYEDLLDERVGYGRNATGGQGGTVCTVTNTNDSGAGSLRDCVEGSGRVWVRFAVDGDITLNSNVIVPSYTTIDARGRYVRIYGAGLRIDGVNDVIVTNLIFKEGNGDGDNDAVKIINGADDVWLHHNSFSNYGDGLVDITLQSTDITVSWCKFSHHDKTMLISASVDHTDDTVIEVTLHHNWFTQTEQRHPRLRYGKVHAFNNYFDGWGKYGMGCSQKGQCLSEGNIFEPDDDTDAIVKVVGEDPDYGKVKSVDDWLIGGATVQENGTVWDPSDHYSYTVETADESLRSDIENSAGAQ